MSSKMVDGTCKDVRAVFLGPRGRSREVGPNGLPMSVAMGPWEPEVRVFLSESLCLRVAASRDVAPAGGLFGDPIGPETPLSSSELKIAQVSRL
jgi:hypothetical protein